MSKKPLYVNCSNCNKIYLFGVFDKSNLEIQRIYEDGSFCHTCFNEYCNECLKDVGIKHSIYDDKGLCKFKKCELKGLLNCKICCPIEKEKVISNLKIKEIQNEDEEVDELPSPPSLRREETSFIKPVKTI